MTSGIGIRPDLQRRHDLGRTGPRAGPRRRPRGASLDRERAADEQRALAHASQPAVLRRARRAETAAVVGDAQDDAVASRVERDRRRGSALRVARDVGQALLRDPVDGELDLRRERRERVRRSRARRGRPTTRAKVVASSVSALTSPRCSSISGRSSLEIRRTSSSARRTAWLGLVELAAMLWSAAPRSSSAAGGRRSAPGRPRRADRARSRPARPLERRAHAGRSRAARCSSRSSMRLNAARRGRPRRRGSDCSRWPGRSRSTISIRCAKSPSGANARRSRTAFDDDRD